jgi:hypothetical protein
VTRGTYRIVQGTAINLLHSVRNKPSTFLFTRTLDDSVRCWCYKVDRCIYQQLANQAAMSIGGIPVQQYLSQAIQDQC